MRAFLPLLIAFSIWSAAQGAESEAPKDLGLKEQVSKKYLQIPVTILPKDGDPSHCDAITKAMLQVKVGGKEISDYILDRGAIIAEPPTGDVALSTPRAAARTIVLVVDEWHLLHPGQPDFVDSPRERAIEQIREHLSIPTNDRFILMRIAEGLKIYSPHPESYTNASGSFERMLAETAGPWQMKMERAHEDLWWTLLGEGLQHANLLEPGSKDVFLFASDLPVDGSSQEHLRKLSEFVWKYNARLNTQDVISDERIMPEGHLALAEAGGGQMFSNGSSVTTAIAEINRMTQCNFLIALNKTTKANSRLSVTLPGVKGFRVIAPIRIGGSVERTELEDLNAFLSADEITSGIRATASVDPIRVTEEEVEVVLVINLEIISPSSQNLTSASVGSLRVYGALWRPETAVRRSAIYGDVSGQIWGKQLEELFAEGRKAFRFPGTFKIPRSNTPTKIVVGARSTEEQSVIGSRQFSWERNSSTTAAAASQR